MTNPTEAGTKPGISHLSKGDQFAETYVVSADVYRGFIGLFADANPLHTNGDYARSKGFRDCVMHGNILGGFLSHFVGEVLPLDNVIIHSQAMKYKKPVYLNEQLRFHAEVTDVFESVNVVEIKFYFENADQVRVAQGTVQVGIL